MDCRRHKLGMQSADSIFSHSTFLNDNLAQKVTRMRTLPLAQLRILNITSLFVFLYLTCFATPVAASSKISIKATGASFPNDIYQKLIRQFMSIHGASAISSFDYIGDTSTAGLATQNVNMSYQFGGSDIAVDPRVYNQSTLIALPAVAG
ncbi:hypothetical protein BC829DRAFT_384092 [Chytridium lagenaria]|nr:hypothetical protein BC829DRAFT_384092 [Chytridium lagenaria]